MQRLKAFGFALLAVLVMQTASLTPNLQSPAATPHELPSAGIHSRALRAETHFAEFLAGATAGMLAGLSLRHRISSARARPGGATMPGRATRLGGA